MTRAEKDKHIKIAVVLQEVMQPAHSLEYDGHFGRALYFKLDIDGGFEGTMDMAAGCYAALMALLSPAVSVKTRTRKDGAVIVEAKATGSVDLRDVFR